MIVHVPSPTAPYDVHVDRGTLDRLPESVGDAARVAIICPDSLGHLAERAAELLDPRRVTRVGIPDAEAAKTPQVLTRCWDALAAAGFTRSDVIVGIGGGTATDLAGFVAATWLRGVRYVAVPTSVLAMVDAAVGGKTGINLVAGKNLVGAFHEPVAVLADLALLDALPVREISSGMAEVVKCGLIADARILELLQDDLTDSLDVGSHRFAELVARAIEVKARVVSDDLRERTSTADRMGREALNYGHTLGHAIEADQDYRWRHGQAISVGMVWIAEVASRALGLDADAVALHRRLLAALGLPVDYPLDRWTRLRELMSIDKKARGSRLRLVALRALGEPVILEDPDEELLVEAYRALGG